MPPTLLRRLVTPLGISLALGFVATGFLNIYFTHATMSAPELLFDIVVFFFFAPTLALWERRREATPTEGQDESN